MSLRDQVKRIELPVILAIFCLLVVLVSYFVEVPEIGLGTASSRIQAYATIVAAFAVTVGVIAMVLRHAHIFMERQKGMWPFSLWTIIVCLITFLAGIITWPIGGHPLFTWMSNNVYAALEPTVYSLTGFFIVSVAYRAFTARTKESAILLITGILVMLRNAPLSAAAWPGFSDIGTWIMDYVNTAGMRAIIIGAAVGAIASGLRMILGYERGFLGGAK